MRSTMRRVVGMLLLAVVGGASVPALADGWYVAPRAGANISIDRADVAGMVGLSVGYRWNFFLSTDLTYSRIIGGEEANLIELDTRVGWPFSIWFPYVLVGAGMHVAENAGDRPEALWRLGGGLSVKFIEFAAVTCEVSYINFRGDRSAFEPALAVAFQL